MFTQTALNYYNLMEKEKLSNLREKTMLSMQAACVMIENWRLFPTEVLEQLDRVMLTEIGWLSRTGVMMELTDLCL